MPWGQSDSTLLPSWSLARGVNGVSSSLPGSCRGRGWGWHPSLHSCIPAGPHGEGDPPIPPGCGPLSCTLQCLHTQRHSRCHHPQWQPPPGPARGWHGPSPGTPRAACRSSQRQQDEAPWPPCVRWGPSLPREVSSKTSRRKALGDILSLWAIVGLPSPAEAAGDSGRGDAPANRTRGGRAAAGMRKPVVAPGCCQDP